MRAIWKKENLRKGWDDARQESKAAFDNDAMYLEKLIVEPRHIEIQIIGDAYGKACHLSERDCSVQRRHQKLTEETPSPFMTYEAMAKKWVAELSVLHVAQHPDVSCFGLGPMAPRYERVFRQVAVVQDSQ